MGNLFQIVNLIANAVNARLAVTLMHRIQYAQQAVSKTSGWFDRTSAGSDTTAALTRSNAKRMDDVRERMAGVTAQISNLRNLFSENRRAFRAERTNPTGMSPESVARLRLATAAYYGQMLEAAENQQSINREQVMLREAYEAQIEVSRQAKKSGWFSRATPTASASSEDSGAMDQAMARLAEAISKRDELASRYQSHQQEMTHAATDPTSTYSSRQLASMVQASQRYQRQTLQAATEVDRLNAAHKTLIEAVKKRIKAENIASERHGTTKFGQAVRRASVNIRRALGSRRGPLTDRLRNLSDAFSSPKKFLNRQRALRSRRDEARADLSKKSQLFSRATAAHRNAKAAYGKNPTTSGYMAVQRTGRAATAAKAEVAVAQTASKAATTAAAATEGVEVLATVMGALGVAAAPLATALAAVVTGVGSFTAVTVAMVMAVRSTLAAGMQEVERFSRERARYSAGVSNSLIMYELQSRQLEAKSTSATEDSAQSVIGATMRAREAVNPLSNKTEEIANTILAMLLDGATGISNIANTIDEMFQLSSTALTALDAIRQAINFIGNPIGIDIKAVARNTKKETHISMGANFLQAFHVGNRQGHGVLPPPPLNKIN